MKRALLIWLLLATPLWAQDPELQRLAAQLQHADAGIRRQAAIALGRIGQPQSVRLLRAARAAETQSSIRLEIVRALRHIAFLRFPGFVQALQALGEAADDVSEADEHVRLRATEALWEAGEKDLLDPLPFLERTLSDRSQRLRLAAVQMLRQLGTPPTIDALGRTALDSKQSATIRLEAIEALGAVSLSDPGPAGRQTARANIAASAGLGHPPLVTAPTLEKRHEAQIRYLAAVLRNPENSPTLALRALKSMGQVKDKSSIPVLRQVIESHRNEAVRKQATRVLSHVLARQYE